jgi:UDP:flavonoid glycosyltransferase YjiC (YdhE family)
MDGQNNFGIACFISPHGFGHAARASAIMASLADIDSSIHFHVFTTVPKWFFLDSLTADLKYHSFLSDIGLAQTSPFKANLAETLKQLNQYLPFDQKVVQAMALDLIENGCKLVICDIAPIGIAVAREMGVPSVLIENFTWDWIYASYLPENRGLEGPIAYLRDIFNSVDYRIQTEPVCNPCNAHLTTEPVSRKPRNPAPFVKEKLGIPQGLKVVLVTLGGLQEEIPHLERLMELDPVQFIIPGSNGPMEKRKNLIILPRRSDFFHPDLMNASDAVIGKVGYSTLAEAYHAGIPLGYISRNTFRESTSLVSYVEGNMQGVELDESAFFNGQWSAAVPELIRFPRISRKVINGADQAAGYIFDLLRKR